MIILVSSERGKTGEKEGRVRLFCLYKLGIFLCYLPSSLVYWIAQRSAAFLDADKHGLLRIK